MTRRAILISLSGDRRGAALIEFAIAMPVLMLLFVAGYQLMDAISAYRKVTTTVRALADLTTQSTSMTPGGAQQILAASQQIMAPYTPTNAQMRITQFKIDASGNVTVDWSQAVPASFAFHQGDSASPPLPAPMIMKNTYLIYSEINYQYVPTIASGTIGPIPLRDTIYMSPRNSASIPCSGC